MICVIPSAGRAETMTTHKLFREAFVCVPESQVQMYRKYIDRVVPHPDTVYGMGQKRQWILDNFDEDIIFMADDDIDSKGKGRATPGLFSFSGTSKVFSGIYAQKAISDYPCALKKAKSA